MGSSDLLDVAKRRLYANYKPSAIVFARGKGCDLFDTNGKRYLDLCAGVAVCAVGHAHPRLVKAIADQAATAIHVSNYFYNEPNIRLADELCKRTGYDRAFFCNSGTEANEATLKLARHHHFGLGDAKRVRIIAFHNAFHGRSLGALSMTGTPKYREGFGELGAVTHVDYGNLDAVKAAMGDDVAAINVEPLQGEGGVLPAPAGFLAALRALCDASGALLLIDEVQTGVGRLGKFLASEGVRADAVALAKGLGGGFPIGAMLTTEKVAGALPPGTHGSTFGGNPLACAASLAVLSILDEEKLVDGARVKGDHLASLLQKLATDFPAVCEGVRGSGLLQGLVMKPGFVARDVLPKLADAGVLLTAAGERVIRFSPPLVVTNAELEEGVRVLRGVIAEMAGAAKSSTGTFVQPRA
jgi:acetylornithine/N-succinyldiaminopimelate aminotransferase